MSGISKKSQQVAILCGLAATTAAAAYLLVSRTKKTRGDGDDDAFTPAALESCKSEAEGSVTVRTRNPPVPVEDENLGAKSPTIKRRRNKKQATGTQGRYTSNVDMGFSKENQQNVANTSSPPDVDSAAAMAAKAAGQALASAALIAAKKAAKNKQKKKNSRKKKGTAQRAAVKEIHDFQKSQSGKKYSQALSARREVLQ